MSSNSVIWKTSPDNLWRLYKNTDYKIHDNQLSKESTDKKSNPKGKPQISSPFSFTKLKPMTKGSLACTSKGYGIIQSLNEDKKTITVKIEGQIYELSEEEVVNEVPLNVVLLTNSLKLEEVLYIPTSCTINEMIEKLESSLEEQGGYFSLSLFFNGKELESSFETLEKLRIMPWSKLLGVIKLKKPLSIKRYTLTYTGWNLSVGSVLGLSFMPSKNMRIIGVGLYKPQQNQLNAVLNLISGQSIKGDVLWTKSITLQETKDKDEVERIMFNRPFLVRGGEYVSITLTFNAQCTSHYGNGGKPTVEAEGEIMFSFKVPDDMPQHMNGHDAGQFPEIYYYA